MDSRSRTLVACDPLRHALVEYAVAEHSFRVQRVLDLSQVETKTAWPIEPSAMARASDGTLAVADQQNGCAWLFDRDLRLLTRLELGGAAPASIRALAFSSDAKRVALLDHWSSQITVCEVDRSRTARLEFRGLPTAIRGTPDGGWIVSDSATCQIVVLGEDGSERSRLGKYGSGALEFGAPGEVVPGNKDCWIVLDPGNSRAQVLSVDGKFRYCL